MNPNLYRSYFSFLCFSLLSLGMFAQSDSIQETVTMKLDGQWKKGSIILSNGNQYLGEIRCIINSGSLAEHLEFRRNSNDSAQIFMADSCEAIKWGNFELITLPKSFKRPYDKMFYMTLFNGNSINVFFEPKFTDASKPESLRFVIHKEGVYISVTKSNFKRTMRNLLDDSHLWMQKAQDDEWFTFTNMYEVLRFYDQNLVLVTTDFED